MLQAFQDIFAKCRIVSVLLVDAAPTAFKKRRPLSLPFTRQVLKLPLKLLLKDGRLRNSKVERVGKAFRDHLKGISTLLSLQFRLVPPLLRNNPFSQSYALCDALSAILCLKINKESCFLAVLSLQNLPVLRMSCRIDESPKVLLVPALLLVSCDLRQTQHQQ